MPRSSLVAALVATLLAAAPASAFRLPAVLGPISGNPAERLAAVPVDPETYDAATHCAPRPRPGVVAMVAWLQRHAEGVNWGTYRCEMWGRHSASLHAESRAIDWHPASRAAAAKLIDLLLAPDAEGNAHALARRMGVEELIWDCSYWGAGMAQFERYGVCYGKTGQRKKHVDPTVGHLNHVHIGISKAGAAAKTSFWRSPEAGR